MIAYLGVFGVNLYRAIAIFNRLAEVLQHDERLGAFKGGQISESLTVRVEDGVVIVELNGLCVQLNGLLVVAFHLFFIAKVLK